MQTTIDRTANSQKLNDLFDNGVHTLTPEVEALFVEGIDPKFRDHGFTLLHTHVQKGGNPEVVKMLLDAGVDPMEKGLSELLILEDY